MKPLRIVVIYIGIIFYIAVFLLPSNADSVITGKETWRSLSGNKEDLYKAAKTILVIQGFEMKRLDETAGILETALSPMRLNLSGCECGTAGGPIEDTRPLIHVAVAVAVEDNRISIRAAIKGDYPKNQVSPAIIEDDLYDQIVRYLE